MGIKNNNVINMQNGCVLIFKAFNFFGYWIIWIKISETYNNKISLYFAKGTQKRIMNISWKIITTTKLTNKIPKDLQYSRYEYFIWWGRKI